VRLGKVWARREVLAVNPPSGRGGSRRARGQGIARAMGGRRLEGNEIVRVGSGALCDGRPCGWEGRLVGQRRRKMGQESSVGWNLRISSHRSPRSSASFSSLESYSHSNTFVATGSSDGS